MDLQKQNYENPIERIPVITFTEKAAAEMKERILKQLTENEIDTIGQDNIISTIHGFCSSILRKHSIEAGLSPDFKLADDTQQEEIFDVIIKKIKYGELETTEDIENVFNILQLDKSLLHAKNLIKLKKLNRKF